MLTEKIHTANQITFGMKTQSGYHMKACCTEVPFLIPKILDSFFKNIKYVFNLNFKKAPGVLQIVRDASGNVTSMKGISEEMLNWMALAFNLT